jgi:hypothetical protein
MAANNQMGGGNGGGNDSIAAAINRDDAGAALRLIAARADVNAPSRDGVSPLLLA